MKRALIMVLAISSINAFGAPGYIVEGAVVERVSSSSGNGDVYRLYYSGGANDTCSGQVRFYLSAAGSEGVFNKAFTLATTALVSGKKVNVYSYTDASDCDSAVTIELRK